MEKEGRFFIHTSKRIEVEQIPAKRKDCVYEILAMAYNTLSESETKFTGVELQEISERYGIQKGMFERLLNKLNKLTKSKGIVAGYFEGNEWTNENIFEKYKSIINRQGLIFMGIDSHSWYKRLGYALPEDASPHALLINGYEESRPKYLGFSSKKVILRDTNIYSDIKIEFDLLYKSSFQKYSSEYGIVAFFQKGNPAVKYKK